MGLMGSADSRRAWRTVERVLSAIAMLAMLGFIVAFLRGDADWLGWIAMGLIVILAMREFLIGSENVAARIDFSASKDGLTSRLESNANKDRIVGKAEEIGNAAEVIKAAAGEPGEGETK